MKRIRRWWMVAAEMLFLLALFAVLAPTASASSRSVVHPAATMPFQAMVVNYANVRSGPSLSDRILTISRPGVTVTVYAQVRGQSLWAGSTWDRVSPLSASPRYIYGGLVQQTGGSTSGSGASAPPAPRVSGKSIRVVLSRQWLWAYENGKAVFSTPVTTAQPGLVTPVGVWHIFSHLHPTTFYSPWPPGSPYWYPPTHINYAMGFHSGGYFLHDAYWRSVFGPGTNVWHYDPVHGWLTGTHGCINAPLQAIVWLYYWAPNGTTLEVDP